MLCCERTDPERDFVRALCNADRGSSASLLPFQCDGEMGGVDDDDIRLGHIQHHAVHCDFLPALASSGACLWVSLAFLVFVNQVLVGHAVAVAVLPDLPKKISRTKDHSDD